MEEHLTRMTNRNNNSKTLTNSDNDQQLIRHQRPTISSKLTCKSANHLITITPHNTNNRINSSSQNKQHSIMRQLNNNTTTKSSSKPFRSSASLLCKSTQQQQQQQQQQLQLQKQLQRKTTTQSLLNALTNRNKCTTATLQLLTTNSMSLTKMIIMTTIVLSSLFLFTLTTQRVEAASSPSSATGGTLIKTLSDAIPEVPYNILHNMRQIDHAAPFYGITKMGAKDSSNNHYTMVGALAPGLSSPSGSMGGSSSDAVGSLIRSPIWKRIADGYGEFTSEFRSMLRSPQGGLKLPNTPSKLIRDFSVPALLYLLFATMPDDWRPTRTRRKSQAQLLPTDSLISSSNNNPMMSSQQQQNSFSLYPANQQHHMINLPPQTAAAFSSNPQASMDQMTNSLYYTNTAAANSIQGKQVNSLDSNGISHTNNGDLQTSGSSSSNSLFNGAQPSSVVSSSSSPNGLSSNQVLTRRQSNPLNGLFNDMNTNEPAIQSDSTSSSGRRSTWSNLLHHAVGSLTSVMARNHQGIDDNGGGHQQDNMMLSGSGKSIGGGGGGLLNKDSIKELLLHGTSSAIGGGGGGSKASPLILSAMTLASAAASNSGLLSSLNNQQERSSSSINHANGNSQQQRDLTQFLPNTWREAIKRTATSVQQQATNQWKSIEGQVQEWVDKKMKFLSPPSPTSSSSSSQSNTDQTVSSIMSSLSSAAMNVLGFAGSGKSSALSPAANPPVATSSTSGSGSSSSSSSPTPTISNKNDGQSSKPNTNKSGQNPISRVANLLVSTISSGSSSSSNNSAGNTQSNKNKAISVSPSVAAGQESLYPTISSSSSSSSSSYSSPASPSSGSSSSSSAIPEENSPADKIQKV